MPYILRLHLRNDLWDDFGLGKEGYHWSVLWDISWPSFLYGEKMPPLLKGWMEIFKFNGTKCNNKGIRAKGILDDDGRGPKISSTTVGKKKVKAL